MKTNADYQRAWRNRREEERERMRLALEKIVDRLWGNDKPLATEIREIAQKGLGR